MAKNHIHVKVDGSSQVHVSEILLQYRYAMGHLVNYLQLPFGKWCCCQLLFIVAECCDVWISICLLVSLESEGREDQQAANIMGW